MRKGRQMGQKAIRDAVQGEEVRDGIANLIEEGPGGVEAVRGIIPGRLLGVDGRSD